MVGVIPAAGKGTRMAHITGGGAKELLPVAGRPVLAWVLDEAFAAGCTSIVVVGSPFKADLAGWVAALDDPRVVMASQEEQRGLGHAIACSGIVDDVLVLLPDCLFHPCQPKLSLDGVDVALAVEEVSDEAVRQYGIAELTPGSDVIKRLLEKPSPSETSSRLAVAARYALSAWFMTFLSSNVSERLASGEAGEVDLTGAVVAAMAQGRVARAVKLGTCQRRYDCGSPEGYAQAQKVMA